VADTCDCGGEIVLETSAIIQDIAGEMLGKDDIRVCNKCHKWKAVHGQFSSDKMKRARHPASTRHQTP